MFLSIITPTYNRAYILHQCYESLIAQTDKDFEWVVVDDGSTDNTETLVAEMKAENRIPIVYIKQENGGKQRAHNTAVQLAVGELCVCVDSDDALSVDAVATVKRVWKENHNANIIGVLSKRGDFKEHRPICGSWPKDLMTSHMMELQEEHGFSGDTALFFRTNVLKEHFFKEFEGEKFIPEDSLYAELDDCGEMILLDQVLYYCEYLEDGLTENYRKLLLDNPIGTSYCYYQRAVRSRTIVKKLHNALITQAYLSIAPRKDMYEQKQEKVIMSVMKLVAPFYRKWKMRK